MRDILKCAFETDDFYEEEQESTDYKKRPNTSGKYCSLQMYRKWGQTEKKPNPACFLFFWWRFTLWEKYGWKWRYSSE